MTNTTFWLQMEAQNFSASVFDTQDLSTIRGGSLLLRDLVLQANSWLGARYAGRVTAATLGGSIGLWAIQTTENDARNLASELRQSLVAGKFRHAGFGLAVVSDNGRGFTAQRARLKAVLQRQRLAQARTPYPALTGAESGVCPVDLVRPQGSKKHKIEPERYIHPSSSVLERRRFGMEKKQSLVGQEIGARSSEVSDEARSLLQGETRPFAMQINSISEGSDPPNGLKSNLADKICVIALDGNGFGAIQKRVLEEADEIKSQKEFDTQLANLRALLIERTYSKLMDLNGAGRPSDAEKAVREDLEGRVPDKVVRFETLLWGGDEIMFIVPARVAWELMIEIANVIASARLCNQPVSFAIGAVYCHHDAPISRIKFLADKLCTRLKKLKPTDGRGRDGKAQTLVLPQVLESFDHIGNDIDVHLAKRRPEPTELAGPATAEGPAFNALDVDEMVLLRAAAQDLAYGRGGKLSRGRLRKTAHALHYRAVAGAQYRGGDAWHRFIAESAGLLRGGSCEDALRLIGRDRFFVFLEEFWDYLVPIRADEMQAAGVGGAE